LIIFALENAPSIFNNYFYLFSCIEIKAGKITGSLHVAVELMKRVGITDALGSSRKAALCAWLIFARLIEQGSRLSSVRLAERYDTSILKLEQFDEDDLYEALDWLADNQETIQQTFVELIKSFGQRFGVKKVTFVGDRGMIKSVGIDELHSHEFFYITSLSRRLGHC